MATDNNTLKRQLSVGEVARRSGLAVSALHFYEKRGLIHSYRTSGNQRRYHRDVLRRLAVIKVAQRTGVALDEIHDALSTLPKARAPTAGDWQRLSRRWRASLNERIERLQRLRAQMDSCIGCGCLSLADCPLRNPRDTLSDRGPGAPLLEYTSESVE